MDPIDGHLGCFHFVAVTTNAATDVHVRVFVWTYVFISLRYIYIPRIETVGSHGNSVFNLFTSSEVALPFYVPTMSV